MIIIIFNDYLEASAERLLREELLSNRRQYDLRLILVLILTNKRAYLIEIESLRILRL